MQPLVALEPSVLPTDSSQPLVTAETRCRFGKHNLDHGLADEPQTAVSPLSTTKAEAVVSTGERHRSEGVDVALTETGSSMLPEQSTGRRPARLLAQNWRNGESHRFRQIP